MALVTAAQLREHIPQIAGTGDDTLLTTLSGRADALQASWCGWPSTAEGNGIYKMESASYVVYPTPHWKEASALFVNMFWVTAVTQARVDSQWVYGADTDVPTAEIRIDNVAGKLWLTPASTKTWSTARLDNKITLTNGFTGGSAPEAIILATATTVRWLLSRRRVGEAEQLSGGQGSRTPSDQDQPLPLSVQRGLAPFVVLGGSRVG